MRDIDRKKSEGMIDVERINKETWITLNDCLSILKEIGVIEKAVKGKGTAEKIKVDKVKVKEWVEKD